MRSLQLAIDNYWRGHRITHPVQCSLVGLPTDLVVDAIRDFVTVHDAPLTPQPSYTDWLLQAYGKTFAETFPMVYGRKYHTVAMHQLTTDWIGPRMYRPTIDEVVHGAIAGQRKVHYVTSFAIRWEAGSSYLEPFAERFEIRLDHELAGVDPVARIVRFTTAVRRL